MPVLTNRQEWSLDRQTRPTSDKIIFISCEGQVTEETYFDVISKLFDGVKSRIRFISIMEDAINTPVELRTPEQNRELSKSKPWQLVEKIDKFKEEKSEKYDFQHHENDEFWIISDVDNNTSDDNIKKWEQTLDDCDHKNYRYAISNPFFEVWLLLHHLEPNKCDYNYAVTEKHQYEKTSHFKTRLKNDAHAKLDKKRVNIKHYNIKNVKNAVKRAESLHNKDERWPHNLGSTVYMLINEIVEISDSI